MEWLNVLLTFVVGLGLRLVIPLAVTAVAVYLLRRLDAHWQAEVQNQQAAAFATVTDRTPCWKIKQCSPAQRQKCPANGQIHIPCWQVYRSANGYLREDCLTCEVFRQAPPVTLPA